MTVHTPRQARENCRLKCVCMFSEFFFDSVHTYHGASCPWGELSVGRDVRGAKCPWGEMSVGRDVVGRVVVGRAVVGRVVLGRVVLGRVVLGRVVRELSKSIYQIAWILRDPSQCLWVQLEGSSGS